MISKCSELFSHFTSITDSRASWQVHHQLQDMLVLTLTAVICGANHRTEVGDFGKDNLNWFETFLALPHGIPSHDTFGRIFSLIYPFQFETCFLQWMNSVVGQIGPQIIAIDGKVLRRSYDRKSDKAAIHMVSAWACKNHVVLGQIKVDEQSNEIPTVPDVKRMRQNTSPFYER